MRKLARARRRRRLTYLVWELFARYRDRYGYAGGDVFWESGADRHAVDDVVQTVAEQHQESQRRNRTLFVLQKNKNGHIGKGYRENTIIKSKYCKKKKIEITRTVTYIGYTRPRPLHWNITETQKRPKPTIIIENLH